MAFALPEAQAFSFTARVLLLDPISDFEHLYSPWRQPKPKVYNPQPLRVSLATRIGAEYVGCLAAYSETQR